MAGGIQIAPEVASEEVRAPIRMSYEEFLDWDEEGLRAEWVDGEVVFMSPVLDPHNDLTQFLSTLLRGYSVIRLTFCAKAEAENNRHGRAERPRSRP